MDFADPAPTGEQELLAEFLFSSNALGSFESCACPELPLGGVAAFAAQVAETRSARETPAFLLDTGDRLFRVDMAMTGTEEAERRLKAILLIDVANSIGLDAMNVGMLDLGAGLAFFQKLSRRAAFPVLSANLRSPEGELLFLPSVLLERSGRRVGFVGVLPGGLSGQGYETDDPKRAVRREARALRKRGAELVVLLSNLGPEADRSLGKGLGVDLILGSRGRELTAAGPAKGPVPRGEAGSRGRYLGEARWYAEGRGRGPHFVVTTQPVRSDQKEDKAVKHLVRVALERLKDPTLGLPPIPPPGQD